MKLSYFSTHFCIVPKLEEAISSTPVKFQHNMLENTSTSSSAAAGAPAEDLFRPIEDVVDFIGDPSGSATAQALNFSSGNPRIEEITGVMHLFKNDASSDQLPVNRLDS